MNVVTPARKVLKANVVKVVSLVTLERKVKWATKVIKASWDLLARMAHPVLLVEMVLMVFQVKALRVIVAALVLMVLKVTRVSLEFKVQRVNLVPVKLVLYKFLLKAIRANVAYRAIPDHKVFKDIKEMLVDQAKKVIVGHKVLSVQLELEA